MPPQQAGPSKKAKNERKVKVIEDKTFGLKNKEGNQNQKFVAQIENQVRNNNTRIDLVWQQEAAKKKKKDELLDIQNLLKPVEQKVAKDVDPKSLLCAFFKQGLCNKGAECNFSHDLAVAQKTAKKNLYEDSREVDKDETNENWDKDKLDEVVNKKNKGGHVIDIVCKYFLEAVENNKYGWFWECPNDGDKCQYRHCLPEGYVLRKDRKAMEAQNLDFMTGPEEDEKRVVRAQKDEKFDELKGIIKQNRDAKSNKDLNKLLSGFDSLAKAYEKSKTIFQRQNVSTPRFYIRSLVEIEDCVNKLWEDKDAKAALSKNNAKALPALRQKLKKYVKEQNLGDSVADYRATPDEDGYETPEDEEDDDFEEISETKAEKSPGRQADKAADSDSDDDGSSNWSSEPETNSSNDEDNVTKMELFEYIGRTLSQVKISKDAQSYTIEGLARDYKRKSGSLASVGALKKRIYRGCRRIPEMNQFDMSTKVKMMLILFAKINADFLIKLREDADVEVDEEGRITKYKSNDGNLELDMNTILNNDKRGRCAPGKKRPADSTPEIGDPAKKRHVQQDPHNNNNNKCLRCLKSREDHIGAVLDEARSNLSRISGDAARYPAILKGLIMQGLLRLLEQEVVLRCREKDLRLVEQLLPECVGTLNECGGKTKVSIDKRNFLPFESAGGVELASNGGEIKVSSTLESRLDIVK